MLGLANLRAYKLKLMFRLLICVIGTWLVSSCSPRNDCLEFALASAGANKEELVKVLRHYEGDSLKYRAACFLIENMLYHGYSEGRALAKYRKYFEIYADGNHDAQQLVDSLKKADGGFSERELVRKRDIEKIDSAYLVRNIDFAFRVWREQPWGKQVEFDDFCEYILPYRVGDEPLADWREEVYRKYNPLLDSIRCLPEAEDPLVAAQAIMDEWGKIPFKWTSLFPGGPHIGAHAVEWRSGSCREYTNGVVYLLRALGIPAGIDKAMQRGDNNASHFWAFTLNKNGETYVSEPKVWTKAKEHDVVKAKVARVTYGVNRMLIERAGHVPVLHPVFRPPLFRDVSQFYAMKPFRIKVDAEQMYRRVEAEEPIYLCLSSRMNWTPIDFAFPENGRVVFDEVEGGVAAVHGVSGKSYMFRVTGEILSVRGSALNCFISAGVNGTRSADGLPTRMC